MTGLRDTLARPATMSGWRHTWDLQETDDSQWQIFKTQKPWLYSRENTTREILQCTQDSLFNQAYKGISLYCGGVATVGVWLLCGRGYCVGVFGEVSCSLACCPPPDSTLL